MGGILVPYSTFVEARQRRRQMAASVPPSLGPTSPGAGAAEPLIIDSEPVATERREVQAGVSLRGPQLPLGSASAPEPF